MEKPTALLRTIEKNGYKTTNSHRSTRSWVKNTHDRENKKRKGTRREREKENAKNRQARLKMKWNTKPCFNNLFVLSIFHLKLRHITFRRLSAGVKSSETTKPIYGQRTAMRRMAQLYTGAKRSIDAAPRMYGSCALRFLHNKPIRKSDRVFTSLHSPDMRIIITRRSTFTTSSSKFSSEIKILRKWGILCRVRSEK